MRAKPTWTTLPEGAYIKWACVGLPSSAYGQVVGAYLHSLYAEEVPAGAHVVSGRWSGTTFVEDKP